MLRSILTFFSSYAHPYEKKADYFFRWINSGRTKNEVEKRLYAVMQENLLVFNVWLEKKFKNYHYLTKKNRRAMYANALLIEEDFDLFQKADRFLKAEIEGELHALGYTLDPADIQKIRYVKSLMLYFNPEGRFQYEPASSFGKLLRNPKRERLVGDCNQIVTLYAHLYSRAWPIADLRIKLMPGHVCLHFNGIDIEATTGQFKRYEKYDYIAPITELIPTNLLDVNDPHEATQTISAETFVKSAQLAALLSSKREIVERNLDIAYRNLGFEALRQSNFERAVFFLEKCVDQRQVFTAYHNAVVYYLEHKNFPKAYFYANKKGDPDLKKACYGAEYNELAKTVKNVRLMSEAKNHKATYQKMLALAQKMHDRRLEKSVRGVIGSMQ